MKNLPAASLHVVLALLGGEQHGYALMQAVEELSDGSVRMGPGTLYGTLNRLVSDGLIEETRQDDRRRFYRLTAEGERVASAELARLKKLVQRVQAFKPRIAPA
jgi:DNA-binding PadR family transcriptional regulator